MALNFKNNKNFFIDLTKTIILPVLTGIFFVIWIFYLFQNPVTVFPAIFILFVFIYIFSGHVFGGVLVAFAISAVFFTVAITTVTYEKVLLLFEATWLVFVFVRLERYRTLWLSSKMKLKVENEVLDRDITLIQSSILENEKKSDAINQRLQTFQTLEQIIKSLESTIDEKELTNLIESLTKKIIAKGKWTIKRHFSKDVFVTYTRYNKIPLLITNTKEDTRFSETDYKNTVSLIVMPIEAENSYWGSIKGYSTDENERFNDYDLRLLSIFANILGFILNNAVLFKKIEALAIRDGLTGLYTKTYFTERLNEEFERAKSNKFPLSIAIIDIDHFKRVNDTYGHLAGDMFLRQLAVILRKRFRVTDIISRYGGEEFAVLMPHTPLNESFMILEEVRKLVEKEKFFIPVESYQPIRIKKTVSIGLTEFTDENSTDEFIQKADNALYKAKNSGRNKVIIYKENYEN